MHSCCESVFAEVVQTEQSGKCYSAHSAHEGALLGFYAIGEYALVTGEMELFISVGIIRLLKYRDIIYSACVQI